MFNAGVSPAEDFIRHEFKSEEEKKVQIIVNPIFARELRLTFDNSDFLIGNWSADYIRDNHRMKDQI